MDIKDLDQYISKLSPEGKNSKLWEAIEINEIRMVEALFNKYD